MAKKDDFSDTLTTYLKDKGFVYGPEPEIYGGLAGFYTYGPLGKRLKNNVEAVIRKIFNSNGFYEIEYPIISPKEVWKASGHLDGFNDPVILTEDGKESYRADKLIEELTGIQADHFSDEKLLETIKESLSLSELFNSLFKNNSRISDFSLSVPNRYAKRIGKRFLFVSKSLKGDLFINSLLLM